MKKDGRIEAGVLGAQRLREEPGTARSKDSRVSHRLARVQPATPEFMCRSRQGDNRALFDAGCPSRSTIAATTACQVDTIPSSVQPHAEAVKDVRRLAEVSLGRSGQNNAAFTTEDPDVNAQGVNLPSCSFSLQSAATGEINAPAHKLRSANAISTPGRATISSRSTSSGP